VDVAAAVRFAKRHKLRLVVKGGGHSYLGGSNAADSLLVWTRAMDSIELVDAFVPAGSNSAPVPAVSLGAGCIWGRVYRAVSVEGGRYVQGGGCTTVGVAGLVQGGGFGSFSKRFGIAAASLIQAEIVTSDGHIRIVNASRDPELFWALKGGGGGTFGIVTRMTLETHDLPATLGGIELTIEAKSDPAFQRLLSLFLHFSRTALLNANWGEQVRATGDNRLVFSMAFQGLTSEEASAAWRPFLAKVAANSDWRTIAPFRAVALPARRYWDGDFLANVIPQAIHRDSRAGALAGDYWWAGDGEQVGAFWTAYSSAWLPAGLLSNGGIERLARAWFEASRHWSIAFHFNKGLAGASPETLARCAETAMNPEALGAFALAIISAAQGPAFAGWSEPDVSSAAAAKAAVDQADRALRAVVPTAGSYMSECDYFLADWKRSSWGEHWPKLERIKQRYDPHRLFVVHHGIGSDRSLVARS
jgi:FAD/FMN-containing dehydrogenase